MDSTYGAINVEKSWHEIGGKTIFSDRKGANIEGINMYLIPEISGEKV